MYRHVPCTTRCLQLYTTRAVEEMHTAADQSCVVRRLRTTALLTALRSSDATSSACDRAEGLTAGPCHLLSRRCGLGTDLNSASQVWFRPTSCAYDLSAKLALEVPLTRLLEHQPCFSCTKQSPICLCSSKHAERAEGLSHCLGTHPWP